MSTQEEKCLTFAALHAQKEAWMLPNPWDVGSAKDLEELGFKALATSSAAFAYTLGRKDGEVSLDEKLAHCEAIANNTTVPLNVDFEDGFAENPDAVAVNIKRLAATGAAGCSIEDFSRENKKIFDFNHAIERVRAATEAVADLDVDFQLTARAENLLRQQADLDDTINRLQAFSKAGAHVLYAPGLSSLEQIKQVAENVDRPINVLSPFLPGVTLQALSDAGATRISLGGQLQHIARSKFLSGVKDMLSSGLAS